MEQHEWCCETRLIRDMEQVHSRGHDRRLTARRRIERGTMMIRFKGVEVQAGTELAVGRSLLPLAARAGLLPKNHLFVDDPHAEARVRAERLFVDKKQGCLLLDLRSGPPFERRTRVFDDPNVRLVRVRDCFRNSAGHEEVAFGGRLSGYPPCVELVYVCTQTIAPGSEIKIGYSAILPEWSAAARCASTTKSTRAGSATPSRSARVVRFAPEDQNQHILALSACEYDRSRITVSKPTTEEMNAIELDKQKNTPKANSSATSATCATTAPMPSSLPRRTFHVQDSVLITNRSMTPATVVAIDRKFTPWRYTLRVPVPNAVSPHPLTLITPSTHLVHVSSTSTQQQAAAGGGEACWVCNGCGHRNLCGKRGSCFECGQKRPPKQSKRIIGA